MHNLIIGRRTFRFPKCQIARSRTTSPSWHKVAHIFWRNWVVCQALAVATAMAANFECQRLHHSQPDTSVAETDKGADTRHPPLQLYDSVGFAQLGAGFSSELGEFLLHGQVSAGYMTCTFAWDRKATASQAQPRRSSHSQSCARKLLCKGAAPNLCHLALTEACGDLAQGRDPTDNYESLACGSTNASDAGFLQSVAQAVGCQASQAAGATLTLKAALDRCVCCLRAQAPRHCTPRM